MTHARECTSGAAKEHDCSTHKSFCKYATGRKLNMRMHNLDAIKHASAEHRLRLRITGKENECCNESAIRTGVGRRCWQTNGDECPHRRRYPRCNESRILPMARRGLTQEVSPEHDTLERAAPFDSPTLPAPPARLRAIDLSRPAPT